MLVALQGKCPDSEDCDTEQSSLYAAGDENEDEDGTTRLMQQPTSAATTTKKKSPAKDPPSSAPSVRGGRVTGAGVRRRRDRGGGGGRSGTGDSGGASSDAEGGADDEGSDLSVSGKGAGGRPTPSKIGSFGSFRRRHGIDGGGAKAAGVVSDEERSAPIADEEMTAAPAPASAEKPRRRNTGRTRRPY